MVLFKRLFLLFVILGAASLQAASLYTGLPQKEKNRWQKLLHFDGERSRIDERAFFVDPNGLTDPLKELEKFVELYTSGSTKKWGRLNLSLACAYPARVKFLKDNNLVKNNQKEDCPDFNNWLTEVNPEGLSVIFSTAYPNNPGSMFGHTFLRFHKKDGKNDLLDYGANYAAFTNEADIGIVYAFKGIFGGYRGYFDLAPYYLKVNEYNHGENRDLIEYELNLRPEQVSNILMHLWELYQGASFDYFFTYENCSFHLAELLNVALDEPLFAPKRWYYLPADLIHALYKQENLVKSIKDRPSQMRKVNSQMSQLSGEQQHLVMKSFKKKDISLLKNMAEEKALIALLNLEKYEEKEKFSTENKKLLRDLLEKVAGDKNWVKTQEIVVPFKNRPHLAHDSQKISLGGGKLDGSEVLNFSYQSGYHDLIARDLGLESFSQFKFITGDIMYRPNDKKIQLNEFTFIDVASLHPWRAYNHQLSWKAGLRVESFLERSDCRNCLRTLAEGKLGLSVGNKNLITSLFFGVVEEFSSQYKDKLKHHLAYEGIFGVKFKKMKLLASMEGRHDLSHIKKRTRHFLNLGGNYSLKRNYEIRLLSRYVYQGTSLELGGQSHSLNLGYYF
ncbi:MAG: DUF4105 domain-containing protein [Bacteriovoracaceae bacterium]|nr:DUF4105 domain-containing protein [Bacteriovoracaceae bacterium]